MYEYIKYSNIVNLRYDDHKKIAHFIVNIMKFWLNIKIIVL